MAGMPFVCFDAWKNDFHNDALVPMIGEINRQLAPKGKFKKTILAVGYALKNPETYTRAIDFAMNILGKTEPTMVAAEIAGVETPKADNLRKFLQKMSAKSNAIVEYIEREKAMDNFRTELEKFATAKKGKPLVFFVDELDRCRPIFAVEVLEKIKHVFDVHGVFFVIAVNKNELQKILRAVYGDIDVTVYLRRFFDFEFVLENRGDVVTAALARCQADASDITDGGDLYEYLPLICRDFGVSARDQEQIAALTAYALSMTEKEEFFNSTLFAFYVVLKFDNPDLYKKCLMCARSFLFGFPYAEVVTHYDLKTNAHDDMTRGGYVRNHEHYRPMLSLAIMRYLGGGNDYRQEVKNCAQDARIRRVQKGEELPDLHPSFWEDIMEGVQKPPPSRHLREVFERIELGAKKPE